MDELPRDESITPTPGEKSATIEELCEELDIKRYEGARPTLGNNIYLR